MRIVRFAAALVIALAAVGHAVGAAAGEPLRCVYAVGEAPPFQLGEGEVVPREHPGMAVELMQMAVATLAIDLELGRLPNRRVMPAVADGAADCAFALSFLPERAAVAVYPLSNGRLDRQRRIGSSAYVVYRRAGSAVDWDGRRFAGLEDGAVGINAGFAARDDLVRMGVRVDEADSTASNMRKLAAGRIAAYVVHAAIGDDYLARVPGTGIEKLPVLFQEKDYYVLLSKQFVAGHADLADRLWDRIGALRAQHEPAMLTRYLATVN